MLKAGVAKVEVTPPVGARMAGFAGRVFPSLAVHDPLWAKAIVFDNGRTRLAMVGMDLISISERNVAAVREQAAVASGLAPEAVMIAGSHTHSGPAFYDEDRFTDLERSYWAALPEKLAKAIAEAAGSLVPVRVGVASGWSAIGINRREVTTEGKVILGRNHFGRFDPEVGVVRVERADGAPLAALVNYACHAVCLMADNYLISADYPGFAMHAIEQRLPGVMGIFFQGACGNVNPREAAVEDGLWSGGSFGIAAHAGEALAREAVRTWRKAPLAEADSIRYASRRISLPTNRPRALKQAEAALERARRMAAEPARERTPYLTWYDPPSVERAEKRVARLKAEGEAPVECEVQALTVGPVSFVAWPGEVFCDFGHELKQRTPLRPTYTIGYANGSIGYVPVPEAFQEGGYEAQAAAHLADNAGLVLLEESLSLLEGLQV
ncbi:MAG: neutral/alkaline non-lysosomal ceramidase N-terminal domain-containing protein [Armatimonadota bacterium]